MSYFRDKITNNCYLVTSDLLLTRLDINVILQLKLNKENREIKCLIYLMIVMLYNFYNVITHTSLNIFIYYMYLRCILETLLDKLFKFISMEHFQHSMQNFYSEVY